MKLKLNFSYRKKYFSTWLMSSLTDLLALGVVVAQWFLMDIFTHYTLWNSLFDGFKMLTQIPSRRTDSLVFTFPYLARCHIEGHTSLSFHSDSVLCNLPQNKEFEKIFVCNYIFLAIVASVCGLIIGTKIIRFIVTVLARGLLGCCFKIIKGSLLPFLETNKVTDMDLITKDLNFLHRIGFEFVLSKGEQNMGHILYPKMFEALVKLSKEDEEENDQ